MPLKCLDKPLKCVDMPFEKVQVKSFQVTFTGCYNQNWFTVQSESYQVKVIPIGNVGRALRGAVKLP